MKRLAYIFLMVMTLCLAGCRADDDFEVPRPNGDVLYLRFPEMATVQTRADFLPLYNLGVAFLDADGKRIGSVQSYDLNDLTAVNGEYRISIPDRPVDCAFVAIMANIGTGTNVAAGNIDTYPAKSVVQNSDIDNSDMTQPMYGVIAMDKLCESWEPHMNMVRAVCKTSVQVSESVSDFTIVKVHGRNFTASGYLGDKETTLPSGTSHNVKIDDIEPENGVATFYSLPGDDSHGERLILEAQYHSETFFYPMEYRPGITEATDAPEKLLTLTRNHHYAFIVTEVRATGYRTFEEAENAVCDNSKMLYLLSDNRPDMLNMIACRDFMLAAPDEVLCPAEEGATGTMKIVVRRNSGATNIPKPAVIFPENGWIKDVELKSESGSGILGANTDATEYTFSFTIKEQNPTDTERGMGLRVVCGDLQLEVKLVQKGFNFYSDRNVKIYGASAWDIADGTDYQYSDDKRGFFDIVSGMTAEDMEEQRDNGLHFSVDDNSIYYLMEAKDGDTTATTDDPRVTCTRDGGFWRIALNDDKVADEPYTAHVTVNSKVNGMDVPVTLTVYRRGLVHHIKGTENLQQPQVDTQGVKVGEVWCYYEMGTVTVGGTKYHILDRNVGATSARFYSASVSVFRNNTGSAGAYYRISELTGKADANTRYDLQQSNGVCPSGWDIPTDTQIKNLCSLGEDNRREIGASSAPGTGAAYYAYGILTDQGIIFNLPAAGYYEGSSLKKVGQCCLWTRTPLSGTQGFDTTSADYKYWYLYLTTNSKLMAISNTRFVNGTGGSNLQVGYKGMPIRCVRATDSTEGGTVTPPDPNTYGNLKIFFYNQENLNPLYFDIRKDVNNKAERPAGMDWPGKQMSNEGENWYSFDISSINTEYNKIIFHDNKGNNSKKEIETSVPSNWKDYPVLYYYNGTWYTSKPIAETHHDLYLRGEQMGWENLTDTWKFQTTDHETYTLSFSKLEAGKNFKIGAADWNDGNYGGVTGMRTGTTYTLNSTSDCTVAKEITNGTITFKLSTKQITITGTEKVEIDSSWPVLYLRGNWKDSWGATDNTKMTTSDGNIYTISGVYMSSGNEFKIADSGFSNYNYGTDGQSLSVGSTTKLLNNAGGNLKAASNFNNVTITFNRNTSEITIK